MDYISNNKTYKLRLGEDQDDVIIGNESASNRFEADIKFKRWGNEEWLSFSIEDFNGIETFDSDVVKLTKGDEEVVFYQIDNNKFEFEIVLKSKPQKDKWDLNVTNHQNFNFFYQPELSPEAIAKGDERPDNVIGSYAVYHKTKKNNKYKTGKAFHIYRPKAIDDDGNEVWCTFNEHFDGTLRITVPQAFLDNAVYPVIIDPTFGNEVAGGTNGFIEDVITGSVFTMGATGGTADTISAYTGGTTSSKNAQAGIYLHSDLSFVNYSDEVAIPNSGGAFAWRDWTVSTTLNLTGSADYIIALWAASGGGFALMKYDTGDTDQGHTDSETYAVNTWPDPMVPTHNNNVYSIHCDYTESAGGSVSASPSSSPSASPSVSSSPSTSVSASPSASPSVSSSPSSSPSTSISASPSTSPSASPSASPSVSASPSTSISSSPSASPSVSSSPSTSASSSPSASPSVSASPSTSASASPSASPSVSASPSTSVSASPSTSVSASPSSSASTSISASPSTSPSTSPSSSPSGPLLNPTYQVYNEDTNNFWKLVVDGTKTISSDLSSFRVHVNMFLTGTFTATGTGVISAGAGTDITHHLGRAKIGDVIGGIASDFAGFSHEDKNALTTYGYLHGPNGESYLNSASGQVTSFRIGNVDEFVLSATQANFQSNAVLTTGTGRFDSNLIDPSSVNSVSLASRILYNSSGSQTLEWDSGTCQNSSGTTTIDWNSERLIDRNSTDSLDWFNRSLGDASGTNVLDWNNYSQIDSSGNTSIEWGNRLVRANDGSDEVFNWATAGTAQFNDSNIVTTGNVSLLADNATLAFGNDGTSDSFLRWDGSGLDRYSSGGIFNFQAAADTDITLNFEGTTSSGVMKWDEDNDYFSWIDKHFQSVSLNLSATSQFGNDLQMSSTGAGGATVGYSTRYKTTTAHSSGTQFEIGALRMDVSHFSANAVSHLYGIKSFVESQNAVGRGNVSVIHGVNSRINQGASANHTVTTTNVFESTIAMGGTTATTVNGLLLNTPTGSNIGTYNAIWIDESTAATTDRGIVIDSDTIGIDLGANQDIKVFYSGSNLDIDHQVAATDLSTRFFTNDGDGTDNNTLRIFGVGTQASQTNSESLDISFFGDSDTFEIFTGATGSGTVRDLYLYTDTGTQIGLIASDDTTRIGDADGSNYSKFESDGTLEFNGDATVWKDINFDAAVFQQPAASIPDIDEFKDESGVDTGIATYAFAIGEKVSGKFEMQHDYKEGSNFTFHVHWQGIAAPTGTDNVQWRLTYTLGVYQATLDATTTIDSPDTTFDTQYEFVRSDFAAIDGSTAGNNGGSVGIGDQFLFTLERVAATGDAYAGDALVATVGIHYEVDTVGSRTISAK